MKIIRLKKVHDFINITKIMLFIQSVLKERLLRKMERDPSICEDIEDNHNNIDFVMYSRYLIQTIKLLFFTLNISYFAGISWILFSDYMEFFVSQGCDDSFIGEFGIYDHGKMK